MGHDRVARFAAIDTSSLSLDGGPEFNRLIFSKSPYLLQHADNPVDWYEWGDAAFARARDEDKPVFISIGYATCHWCHVMAQESFADKEVAAVLNRYFVAIKVDREERPDVDDQYMTVSQLLTGSGGWPLNLFLDHDRKPFYATTYLPKQPRDGVIGFVELLERIAIAWRDQRDRVLISCASILDELQRLSTPQAGDLPNPGLQQTAYEQLQLLYDRENGGFGHGHKFPMPVNLQFLLRFWRRHDDQSALEMVTSTLSRMAAGGIHDQLGGGFHRYTVDRQWLVPHFEKMLYDQALLAFAYLEAYQATQLKSFLVVAEEIIGYLERDLAAPEGAFYSAEDADSEGTEGRCYVWTPDQLTDLLGAKDGVIACRVWGVTPAGNFEGKSILHRPSALEQLAAEAGLPVASLEEQLPVWRQQLLEVRSRRIRPLRDEKILTEWNGLAIAALAKAGAVTGNQHYHCLARKAYDFIMVRMVRADGRLMRRWFQGDVAVPALLDDYAALLWGVLELHQATLAADYLAAACHWARELLRLFVLSSGACSMVGDDAEQLLVKIASASDGVVPPGNAMAAASFLRLAAITEDEAFAAVGRAILSAFAGSVARQPAAYLGMLLVGDYQWLPAPVVTLSGGTAVEKGNWIRMLAATFTPGLVLRDGGDGSGQVMAQLCAGRICRSAVYDSASLQSELDELWSIKYFD